MHPHFQIPFYLIIYGIIFNVLIIYGVKIKAKWACKLLPTEHCNKSDGKPNNFSIGIINLYLVLIIFISMFYINFQCYSNEFPYYVFFMISALAVIVGFYYLGMQLLVLDKLCYWCLNVVFIFLALFVYAIAHLNSLQVST